MRCTIQFTGDIMCQIPQSEACRTAQGYDYSPVFSKIRQRLSECDYLVGNLETPLAGEDMRYSEALYSFNTPIAFAYALREAGFDLVSTANNHCVDRGLEGLYRTLKNLDSVGLPHIGTYASEAARSAPYIADIQGLRVGFVAYTYGTNAFAHGFYLPEDAPFAVNLFMPEELKPGAIDLLKDEEIEARVIELYGAESPAFEAHIAPHLARLKGDIDRTRAAGAEFIVLLMHSGGQYNPMPDPYTKKLVDIITGMDVDAIIGNHPHVIHPMIWKGRCPVAYSLGNFSYSPGYSPPRAGENPVYSMLLRLTLERWADRVEAVAIEGSLLESAIMPGGVSAVLPVDQRIQEAQKGTERDKQLANYRYFVGKFSGLPGVSVEPEPWYNIPTTL